MRKVLLSASVFVCLSLCLSAQNEENQILEKYRSYKRDNPIEYSYLKTDKKIYFSGGQIKFCTAILDQYLMPSEFSGTVYLELIHELGEYRKKFVFRVENGVTNDQISIPMDVPSGNFELVAYTHFMRNFSLDDIADRASIYIQNTLEPIQRVAHSVRKSDHQYLDEEIGIDIGETKSKVLFEITSPFDQPTDVFFVSEGYRSIQFVGEIKMRTGKTNIAIEKDQLKGNFQKLILLDDKLNVLTARAYYLYGKGGSIRHGQFSESEESSEKENLFGQLGSINGLDADSIQLFRRIYRLYYRIPPKVEIDHLSFSELTAPITLKSYSDFIRKEWISIIESQVSIKKLRYSPEENINLRGTIVMEPNRLDGAQLAVHFFEDDLDATVPLDSSGSFSIEIPWDIGDNGFLVSVADRSKKEIRDAYSVVLESFDPLSYVADQSEYFPTSLIDSLISDQLEFNYILSTFNEFEESNSSLREIKRMEREVRTEDYVSIIDFEEFIREAVINVSVVRRDGERSLNIYRSTNGTFDKPQMIILNDIVLEESAPLFDIPIELIESVNVVIDKDSLAELGTLFTGGILRVVTKKPVSVSSEYLDDNFGSIVGFYELPRENKVANRFNPSRLLHIISDGKIRFLTDQVDEIVRTDSSMELLQGDGTYHYIYDLRE